MEEKLLNGEGLLKSLKRVEVWNEGELAKFNEISIESEDTTYFCQKKCICHQLKGHTGSDQEILIRWFSVDVVYIDFLKVFDMIQHRKTGS